MQLPLALGIGRAHCTEGAHVRVCIAGSRGKGWHMRLVRAPSGGALYSAVQEVLSWHVPPTLVSYDTHVHSASHFAAQSSLVKMPSSLRPEQPPEAGLV